MSFLKQMKEMKKDMLTIKHPLHTEDESVKLPYLIGVAVLMAKADNELAQSERDALAELAYGLDLPEGRLEKVIVKVLDSDAGILKEIFPALITPEVRYAFVFDLFKAANADKDFKEEEREFITDIIEMMQFSPIETEFLNSFAAAIAENDLTAANITVQKAIERMLEPNVSHLQFFQPGFSYEEEIAGFTLGSHEIRVINRPAKLTGSITVNSGAKLIVKDVTLKFQGAAQLMVDGGEVVLNNAILKALPNSTFPMLIINSNTPIFEATGCTFDGGGKIPLVITMAGKTTFIGCTFTNAFRSGVAVDKFEKTGGFFNLMPSGTDNTKDNCVFGAAVHSTSTLVLTNCIFTKNIAETCAGAVYAGGQLHITDSVFQDCSSSGMGGALVVQNIYKVSGTRFDGCTSQMNGGEAYICGGSHSKDGDEASIIENCSFKKCSATQSGGGLFIDEVLFSVSECQFNFCSAGIKGGGIAATKHMYYPASSLINCLFDNCSAKYGGGTHIRSHSNYRPHQVGSTYSNCIQVDAAYENY